MSAVALILENANDVIRGSRIDWYWAWRGLTCLPIATKHAAPRSRPTALRSVVLALRAAETTCTPPSTWRPSSPGRARRPTVSCPRPRELHAEEKIREQAGGGRW